MVEIRTPISVDEALNHVIRQARTGETETVRISEADGRYLAEDLRAREPVPPFDRSMMDGFAIRAQDTQSAASDRPVRLTVVDEAPAGHVSSQVIQPGQAIRLMTGAPLPPGADAVIELEKTKEHRESGMIEIEQTVSTGNHITGRGEYTKQDEIVAEKGTRISAGVMAMLATFGYANVTVYQQPRIGIFATGTELLSVDSELQPGKIRNSNTYMLQSQVAAIGALPVDYGILPDDFEHCLHAVEKALQDVDIIITTGGASVGDYDYVGKILHHLQAKPLFNKVAMRPGSVTTVALKGDQWIFGLSGNPASCFVGFALFARPVIQTLSGSQQPHLTRSRAILQQPVRSSNPFTRFMRAFVHISGSRVHAEPVGIDKPAVVSALVEANALIVIPGGHEPLNTGDTVDVIWLDP